MAQLNTYVIDVRDGSFEREVLERSRTVPVVVDFWAPWCGPCRALGPLLEKLAGEASGEWVLAKVNTDENQRLARTFQISGIPAVMAFRDGKVVSQFVGAQPERQVREFLNALLPSKGDRLAADGEKKRKAGRFDEAEAAFEAALAGDRSLAPALLGLARLRADQSRYGDALDLIERISPGTPESGEAEKLAARLRVQAAGVGDTTALEREVEQNSKNLDARYRLGLAWAAAARYEDAMKQFIEVVAGDRSAQRDAARKSILDIFQILGPDHPLTIQYRARLASLLYS